MSFLESLFCCSEEERRPVRLTHNKNQIIKEDIQAGFKRNGIGTYTYDNGDQYDGEWMDHKRHGRGKMIYKNGDFFLGQWITDKKGGRGLYVFTNMDKYEGQWKNDLMDGVGKITYENGSYYEGEWSEGKKDGKGIYFNSETKRKYNQQFRSGQRTYRTILKDMALSPNKNNSKPQFFDRPKLTQQDIQLFIQAHPQMKQVREAQMLYYYGICRIKNLSFFKQHPKDWTVDHVIEWSKCVGVSNSCQQILRKQKISGKVLIHTKMNELNEYLKMSLGDKKKWISAIEHLKRQYITKQKDINSQKQKQKTRERKKSIRLVNRVENRPQRKGSFTFHSVKINSIPSHHLTNNPILEQNDEFDQQPSSIKNKQNAFTRKISTHHNLQYQTQDLNTYENKVQNDSSLYSSDNADFKSKQNWEKSGKQLMRLSEQQQQQSLKNLPELIVKKSLSKKKSDQFDYQIKKSSSDDSSESSSSSEQQNPRKRKKEKEIKNIQMRELYQYLRNHKISMNFLIPENQITNLEQIGQGGYGKVFKAKWMSNPVAVKTYMKSGRIHKKGLQNFLQQVGILNDLRHPNIVLYMGMCIQINRYSLITQYLQWGSLFDHLHKKKVKSTLDNIKIFNIVQDIALGMVYLHAKDVLHRDLKSSNVLMDEDWNVKLCDFGLSQVHPKKKMKNPKTRVGTYQWMAPEVLRRQKYDFPADVYSFGMIIWQILTQQIPYDNMSLNQIVGTVGYDQTHRINHPPRGQPYLIDLMYDCLQYKLEDRPSFKEILSRLSQHKTQQIQNLNKQKQADTNL